MRLSYQHLSWSCQLLNQFNGFAGNAEGAVGLLGLFMSFGIEFTSKYGLRRFMICGVSNTFVDHNASFENELFNFASTTPPQSGLESI